MDSSTPQSGPPDLKLPMRFFSAYGVSIGKCVHVSDAGMLAVFDQPLDVWVTGEISMDLGEQHITLKARVAYVAGHGAGLSYRIRSEHDLLYVQMLLKYAEEQNELPPDTQAVVAG